VTYSTEIAKIEILPFAELYKISAGSETFYYTSFGDNVIFDGNTYATAGIKRSTFTFNEKLQAHSVKITMEPAQPLPRYISNSPTVPVIIEITRVFIHDLLAFKKIFVGDVIGVTLQEKTVEADCEGGSIIFRNKIPRILYQSFCNNTLYKSSQPGLPDCNVDPTSFLTSVLQADFTILNSTITASIFGSFPVDRFRNGEVVIDGTGDRRMITNHVGSVITLNIPFRTIDIDTAGFIDVFAGCDKSPGVCQTKFNNFANFQGFPYIPNNNPVLWGFR